MTLEQQRLVRYAEAMGWKSWHDYRGAGVTLYKILADGLQVMENRGFDYTTRDWNPLTDANDALELAEKMDLQFERRCNGSGTPSYLCWFCTGSRVQRAATLPAAICAAVDAALAED